MSNQAADWYSEQEYRERCGMPHEGESMSKQKISNADRIRNMTDDELAEFLHKLQMKVPLYGYDREDAMFEWLKQEVYNDDKR